jgi:hypothetical protein
MKEFAMKEFDCDMNEAKMSINGCTCVFNSPPAKKDGECLSLPPYRPRKAYSVDDYECPENWMHGSAKAASYFVPIQAEKGMWLDFNECWGHSHHIAALISIQGVNPLTGQPMIDTAMRLEQYREKCPKHDVAFGADLFCEQCGYKWVPQNYIATTNPSGKGMFWLDGFRADDGTVRQYYFTEDAAKGVAAQIIGEKRVYAIGIAFYQSKLAKPIPPALPNHLSPPLSKVWKSNVKPSWNGTKAWNEYSATNHSPSLSNKVGTMAVGSRMLRSSHSASVPESYEGESKSLEIGAGAKITQRVYRDNENLAYWEDSPIGMIYINYVQEDDAKRIVSIGKKDRTKKGEGFLAELVTGNS